VTGSMDNHYSIYMDITFQDGTKQFAVTIPFSSGNHDWEKRTSIYKSEKPIKEIHFYALFRRDHTGEVWWDDLSMREFYESGALFEDTVVHTLPVPQQTTYSTINTNSGLELSLNTSFAEELAKYERRYLQT